MNPAINFLYSIGIGIFGVTLYVLRKPVKEELNKFRDLFGIFLFLITSFAGAIILNELKVFAAVGCVGTICTIGLMLWDKSYHKMSTPNLIMTMAFAFMFWPCCLGLNFYFTLNKIQMKKSVNQIEGTNEDI